jgi:hypothetical protein
MTLCPGEERPTKEDDCSPLANILPFAPEGPSLVARNWIEDLEHHVSDTLLTPNEALPTGATPLDGEKLLEE